MTIEPAQSADFTAIRSLLGEHSLPTEDLNADSLRHFLVIRDGERLIGTIGLERHGSAVLLRSLVVAADRRDRGLGRLLTSAAESLAAELNAASIFLLTTTAASFFVSRGFRVVARDEVPDEIRRTTEFASLCPATATVMVKP
jgi:amino-acid N-acetyltransferase